VVKKKNRGMRKRQRKKKSKKKEKKKEKGKEKLLTLPSVKSALRHWALRSARKPISLLHFF
jgi:hypothetical protein